MTKPTEQQSPDTLRLIIGNKTLIFGLVSTIVAIILLLIYDSRPTNNVEIRDYVAVFTCGIVSTTLFYHAKNLRQTYLSNVDKLEFDKQKYSEEVQRRRAELAFQTCSEWFKPGMADNVELSRRFLNLHKEKLAAHSPIEQFEEVLEQNMGDRKAVITVLNYFENLALLLKNDLVCEVAVESAFKTLICDYYGRLERYIKHRQRTSSRYCLNYQELAKKWSVK